MGTRFGLPATAAVLAAVLASAAASGSARAQPADSIAADAAPDPIAVETSALFGRICVDRYPDEAALGAFLESGGYVAMTPGELEDYLHGNAGRGWFLRTRLGNYAVTVDGDGSRGCAIRRMSPDGLRDAGPYIGLVSAAAAKSGLAIQVVQPQEGKTGDGADIVLLPLALSAGDAKPASEVFFLIQTNYHGRYAGRFAEDALGGDGVEVRMVRRVAR